MSVAHFLQSPAPTENKLGFKFSWPLIYTAFYIYRCFYSYLGEVIVKPLTKLGDAASYQKESVTYLEAGVIDSTWITTKIGELIRVYITDSPFFISIVFQTIAYVGILYLLKTLDTSII